jgi:hypothetical protein
MMSSDSPTGGELSGLACRTLWSSTQESGVDEVSEFTGVILTSDITRKETCGGERFWKMRGIHHTHPRKSKRGSPTHEPLSQLFK